jgi:hypothetical protein
MHGEEQDMAIVSESDEASADERASIEMEGLVGFLHTEALEFFVWIGMPAQIVLEQAEGGGIRRSDALDGRPV